MNSSFGKRKIWFNAHLKILSIALSLSLLFLYFSNNVVYAQDITDIDTRLKFIEAAFELIFMIFPGLAAVIVVVSATRSFLLERRRSIAVQRREEQESIFTSKLLKIMEDREARDSSSTSQFIKFIEVQNNRESDSTSQVLKIIQGRESREADSAKKVDSVMNSVNQILAFQAKQAEILSNRAERFDPTHSIKDINDQVKFLRKKITRNNINQYFSDIAELSNRMKNMEDLFAISDFKESIGCHYIRGITAHLQNKVKDANYHLDFVSRLMVDDKKQERDEYIEPLSLYFRGLILKNMGQFGQARDSFKAALANWPVSNNEIRTRIELAEAIALLTNYSPDESVTQAGFNEIERALENGRVKLVTANGLKSRLLLMEGNYAIVNGKWDTAVKHYEDVLKLNPHNIFANLSLGLFYYMGDVQDKAKEYLESTYHLIVKNDQHIIHPEPRGRILLGGSAIMAAYLADLREPKVLHANIIREIEEFRRIDIQSINNFLIFSPITKQMHTLNEFRHHFDQPKKVIETLGLKLEVPEGTTTE